MESLEIYGTQPRVGGDLYGFNKCERGTRWETVRVPVDPGGAQRLSNLQALRSGANRQERKN